MRLSSLVLLITATSARRLADTGTPVANGMTFEATQCLDEQMVEVLQSTNMPGANLAVMYRGQVAYEQGYGTRDAPGVDPSTEGRPALASTPMRTMSISKSVTALTIFRLAQANILSLDDVVFGEGGLLAYLVPFAAVSRSVVDPDVDPRVSAITIRHLLSHTSGLPVLLDPENELSDPLLLSIFISEELGKPGPATCVDTIQYVLQHHSLDFAPGTSAAYNNLAYCVLGQVIEAATGKPYATAVEENLLVPAGIDLSEFYQASLRLNRVPEPEAEYFSQPPYDFLAPSVFPEDNGAMVDLAYGGAFPEESGEAVGGWVATSRQLVKLAGAVAPMHCQDDCLLDESRLTQFVAPPSTYPWPFLNWYVGLGAFFSGRTAQMDAEGYSYDEITWVFRGDNAGSAGFVITTPEADGYTIAVLFNGNNYTALVDDDFETPFPGFIECVGDDQWPFEYFEANPPAATDPPVSSSDESPDSGVTTVKMGVWVVGLSAALTLML